MSLCDSCDYCVIRKFWAPPDHEYRVVVPGDEDEPMIIQYCTWLELVVGGEHTVDCNYYNPIQKGDADALRLSVWKQNLHNILEWQLR